MPEGWTLRRRVTLSAGDLAYDVLGFGPPLLLVWGENDAWLPPSTAERLRELIPASDLELLPDTGHFAMEDSPQQVAATLFDFFTDCTSAAYGGSGKG